MGLLFDILFAICAVIYLPVLVFRGKWHGGMGMRLGVIPKDVERALTGKKNIWLHAVSVGEVMAVEGLLAALLERFPEKQIVLSVTTKTGYALAEKKLSSKATVIWSPLDFSFSVKRFINVINPQIYIAAETELWPNLFRALEKRGIPIIIVNGRISDSAFSRYRCVRRLLKPLLASVRQFCMQSQLDAERILSLGADQNKVAVVGNVKFDLSVNGPSVSKSSLGFKASDEIFGVR